MKKLILIFAILFSLSASTQQFTTLLNGNYTSNTSGTALAIASDNAWSIQVIWSGATGTVNGVIYFEVSNDGTNWIAYASNSYIAISGASGTGGYDPGNINMSWRFIRARYVKGTTTKVTLNVYFNQLIKKTN